jgi:prolyl oligopeptidase
MPKRPPETRRADVVDELHGVKIADPYRWLEDLDSEETAAWVKAQNEVTFELLEGVPERAALRERLTRLWDFEKYGVPVIKGGRAFFAKNDGLQDQSPLYVADSLDGEPRLLLDPNTLSADGTTALAAWVPSSDGTLLAYGLTFGGSDWMDWKVLDVASGKDLADHLKWIKFSAVSWTRDGKGFYYSRYDEPRPGQALEDANYWNKLFFHRLGTSQAEDELVYERKDEKEWGFYGGVTEDGRYLVITIWRSTEPKNLLYYRDLEAGGPIVELIPAPFEAEFRFVANEGPLFWFKTNLGAPRGKLIAIDITDPAREKWRTVIPEAPERLEGVSLLQDVFVAAYLQDAHSVVRVLALDGTRLEDVALPGLGTVMGFDGERHDELTFYSFAGFTTPTEIWRWEPKTRRSTPWRRPKVDFDPGAFETRQVFYTSKDGTRVPMFVCHKKGLVLDGSARCYLYGYGGFDVAVTPQFMVSALVWMELGGVYAVANLRGGGEYGEDWHRAGTRLLKQNVFDDFIAAAEWLIANRYTTTPRLAIGGGSNGGLLVGACMTQRPDLFGAALPTVGVLDMLRFHKFTIGWAWVDDYGSADDPEEFRALLAYSPLHNVRPGTRYPATLISTADHDDRVVPAHSFKFAAALQAAQAGDAPVLIRIDVRAGHGMGKPTGKLIDEIADKWAFLLKVL